MQQIYRGTSIRKCDFSKVALQLYSAWVYSCKFASYLQNNCFQEHLWKTASAKTYSTWLPYFSIQLRVLFFHTFNSIAYHTWILPQIFEYSLNSISQMQHITWRGDKNLKFQVTSEEKITMSCNRRS